MKTSQLDLDFARSQYGEEAVAGFDKALASSRDELSRAFALRQQLDDDMGGRGTGTDEPTTRQMLGEMLRLTAAADARLDEQAEAFAAVARPGEHRPRRCWRRSPRGSPSSRGGSRRRSSGWPGCGSASPRAALVSVRGQRHRGAGPSGGRRAGGQPRRSMPSGASRPGDRGGRHPGRRGRRRADHHAAGRGRPAGGRPRCGRAACGRRAGRDGEGPGGPRAGRDRRRRRAAAADRPRGGGAGLRRRAPCARRTARRPIRWPPCGSWRRPTSRWSKRCRWRATPRPRSRRAGRRPRPGAAHRALHDRGGGRLHRHPPRRRRPRGAHPARRGPAAPPRSPSTRAATTRSTPWPAGGAPGRADGPVGPRPGAGRRLAVVGRRLRRWLRRWPYGGGYGGPPGGFGGGSRRGGVGPRQPGARRNPLRRGRQPRRLQRWRLQQRTAFQRQLRRIAQPRSLRRRWRTWRRPVLAGRVWRGNLSGPR